MKISANSWKLVQIRGQKEKIRFKSEGFEPPVFEEKNGGVMVTIKRKSLQELTSKSKEKSKEKIKRLLSANPFITIDELIKEVGLSVSGIERNIRILKRDGEIQRIGGDKGGHWVVLK